MNNRFLSISCALLVTVTSFASLPIGWRYPNVKELSTKERASSKSHYAVVNSDLNGDGVNDSAVILINSDKKGEALWVKLSVGISDFKWIKLDEIKAESVAPSMGIEVAKPGEYSFGCYDEDSNCSFGPEETRLKLSLTLPGIEYFRFESASSIFYWDVKLLRFRRVWTSD